MKQVIFMVVFVIVFSALPLFAQNTDTVFEQKVEIFIGKIMAENEIPGISIGVVKNGEIYYSKGFGVQNIETKVPVSDETIFHMASVSKPFVATAIMQLVEAGKVNLDDPVINYLPYFKLNDERYREITLKQMLTHTSGMPDVTDYQWGEDEKPAGALTRYTLSLKDKKLLAAPGEKWAYSNMAFEVLGNLIEKVSGLSFEEYVSQNILAPLGMKRSNFLIDERFRLLYADGHIRQLSMQVSPVYPYNPKHAPSSTLHANSSDMCRWALANLKRGEYENRRILKASSYNQLWKPYSKAKDDLNIGLSWFISGQNGEMKVQHGGGDLGFSTYFSMKPRKMSAVIVLTNHDYSPVQGISNGIWTLLEGGEAEMPKIPILVELSKILVDQDVQVAINRYDELKKNQPEDYNFGEVQLNLLGYNLMAKDRLNDAIEIFKLNVAAYPESFNPYDSLGEAYLKAGKKELAVENYEKSLFLNPDNANGKKMLAELKGISNQLK